MIDIHVRTGHAQLFVNGRAVSTNLSLNDGNWNHLCASWTSVGGQWNVYVNGTRRAAGRGLATNTYILGGGLLVLGIRCTASLFVLPFRSL